MTTRKAVVDMIFTKERSLEDIEKLVTHVVYPCPVGQEWPAGWYLSHSTPTKTYWVITCDHKIIAFGFYEDVKTKEVMYITSPSSDVVWDKDEFEKWACAGNREGIYSHHTEGRLNENTIPFSFTYRVVEK